MVRICRNCNYENKDEYDFCAKCGTPLTEKPNQLKIGLSENAKRKLIIISYLITILLSWGGVLIYFLKNQYSVGYLGFFGIFMPFYLIQAPDKKIRKHGYIMLLLSVIGISLSFYLLFYKWYLEVYIMALATSHIWKLSNKHSWRNSLV